jgi:hypothetical protein
LLATENAMTAALGDISPAMIARVRELLRRAILTLAVVPDPDLRYRLGPRGNWPSIVRDARDAYGYAPPKMRAYHPTPEDQSRYLDVLAWLRWYEAEYPIAGPETVRIFIAWTFGAAMWQLQVRCSTNRRMPATPVTVRRRIDGMARTIAGRFSEALQFDGIDECRECMHLSPNPEYGENSAETDLRHLPTSPKACISATSEPMTAKEKGESVARQVARERALAKRLRRMAARKAAS